MHISKFIWKNGNEFNNLDGDGNIDVPIRLVNNYFAYAISIATLSITGGEETEVPSTVAMFPQIVNREKLRFITILW